MKSPPALPVSFRLIKARFWAPFFPLGIVVLLQLAVLLKKDLPSPLAVQLMLTPFDLVFVLVILLRPLSLLLSADGLAKKAFLWSAASLPWQSISSVQTGFMVVGEGKTRTRRVCVIRLSGQAGAKPMDFSTLDWEEEDLWMLLQSVEAKAPAARLDAATREWIKTGTPNENVAWLP
jgi:hypothetical protein